MTRTYRLLLIISMLCVLVLTHGCGEPEVRRETSITRVLDNGLTAIVKENHSCEAVSVQIWVRDGGLYEAPSEAGLASLLSRMVFDQTPSRGPGEIARLIEGLGGVLYSSAMHDYSYYMITVPSADFGLALETLTDGVMNAVFEPARVKRVRRSLRRQIMSLGESPIDLGYRACVKELLGGHPYGRPAEGTLETVASFTADDVAERHSRFYVPGNMTIVVAGDVVPGRAAARVESVFGGYERVDFIPTAPPPAAPPSSSVNLVLRGDFNTAYQVLGFPGPDINDPGNIAMDVLLMVLARGRSSRLNRLLKEELKLVGMINAAWYTTKQPGMFAIWMALDPDDAAAAEEAIVRLVSELHDEPIGEEELEKAKMLLESDSLYKLETCNGQASFYGYFTAVKDFEFADDYISAIGRVTREDVQDVAARFLRPEARVTALVMPEWAD